MTAQMSAQILHALNQVIRINSQLLQLQSERLASETKGSKDSVRRLNKMSADIGQVFRLYQMSEQFPRF